MRSAPFWLLLLAACGQPPIEAAPLVPGALLAPCPGWQGPTPATQGDLIAAAAAERSGRLCANDKLASVKRLVAAQGDQPQVP